MPEQNGQSDLPTASSDLDALEAKLAAARARREPKRPQGEATDGTLLGMAWRLSTELLASVLVGFLLGYGLDFLFGSKPWGMLVGLGLGIAAGFMSVFRTASAMDARNADVPLGDAMPLTPDEE